MPLSVFDMMSWRVVLGRAWQVAGGPLPGLVLRDFRSGFSSIATGGLDAVCPSKHPDHHRCRCDLLLSDRPICPGFIGSHACKALANAGYLPLTVDNLERGHAQAVKWGPLEHADIRDEHAIRRIFEHWRPEAVLHFAAYAYVGESIVEPLKYYQTNVGGTSALLKACVTSGCNRIVYSSSCATYGIPVTLPIAENHPQQPINPYGFTKLVVERMLHDADLAHGIKHVTLRYFNAAGADPDGELGERHDPETHPIPLVLRAALDQRSSIKVFGNDYPTADGTCVRDYVHVSDLADAHVAALEWLFDKSTSETFKFRNGPWLLGRADRARSRRDYR